MQSVTYFSSFGLPTLKSASLTSSGTNVENLGGKGHGLVWMSANDVPVPPGFVMDTHLCRSYFENVSGTMKYIEKNIPMFLEALKAKFGYMPLVSVRSGARVSMPGMMDTILNVGLDSETYPEWAERLGTEAATDSFCRLIEMYGSVVRGIDRKEFAGLDLQARFALYRRKTNEDFPDAKGQIISSIEAVFKSWHNERAKVYRKAHGMSDAWGTACVVQAMVFGNMNDQSGTGVLFTRNPDTGENKIVGEFLTKAQGEDVVAGIRTPMPLSKMVEWNGLVAQQLNDTVSKLEKTKGDVQDVEFTIQNGELFILQTRNAKRSARAALRIALDMHKEGVLTQAEALKRVTGEQYDRCRLPVIDPAFKKEPNWTGIPACNGVVTGIVVLTSEAAINCKESCILVREETCPDDIAGMIAAKGVLTMTGGATSHAAVVARSMDKPCVVGLGITEHKMFAKMFPAGATISIDGATGRVWNCTVPISSGENDAVAQEFDDMVYDTGAPLAFDRPSKYAKVLDLSGLLLEDPKKLAAMIVAQNALTPDGVVVDMLPDEEQMKLYCMFGDEFQAKVMAGLDKHLPELPKVKLFSQAPSMKMTSVTLASTLEQLILAKGTYLYNGKTDATVKQVMAWLEKDGVVPSAGGKSESVAYLSQLVLG